MIEKIERTVFFWFTRAFAWLVIVGALLVLVSAGIALLKASGTPGISVGYDEVQSVMEGKPQPESSLSSPASREENIKEKYGNDVNDILKAFGQQDNQQNEKVVFGWISAEEKQDRRAFVRGLVESVRKAPQDKRSDAANAYKSLWYEKKAQRSMESLARSANKTVAQLTFAGAFSAVALFSLILILLAIEKNTRERSATAERT